MKLRCVPASICLNFTFSFNSSLTFRVQEEADPGIDLVGIELFQLVWVRLEVVFQVLKVKGKN
jgi:hypothetical protein